MKATAANHNIDMRILGLDPATAGPTGYGLVQSDGKTHRVVNYGAFRVPAARQKQSPGAVLQDIHVFLGALMQDFAPTVIAVESVFTALNMRTALRLAEVRGVVLLAAAQHGLAVYSYSPREVKACVSGYGHADKRQMQLMVRALLSMPDIPEPADAADALAVALCHLQAEQTRLRFGLPDKPDKKSIRTSRASTAASASAQRATALSSARIELLR